MATVQRAKGAVQIAGASETPARAKGAVQVKGAAASNGAVSLSTPTLTNSILTHSGLVK